MVALMAFRQHISLAPLVLGYIYCGLEEATCHPNHPSKASVICPTHYIIGWLADLFPCLYRCHPYSNCPGDFPTLVRYAGLLSS